MLKKMLTTPPLKRIDLAFPLGLTVTARNLRGVTIKDALDAIYKQFKKKVRLTLSLFRHLPGNPSLISLNLTDVPSFPLPGRRRALRPLPQGLRMGPRRVLHALHRAPDEDGRAPRDRGQEEEEGQQGWRRRLNDRAGQTGKRRKAVRPLFFFFPLVAVTHFGGELTDLSWAGLMMALRGGKWKSGNSDQRISLGV